MSTTGTVIERNVVAGVVGGGRRGLVDPIPCSVHHDGRPLRGAS